ncbi:MAG: DUF1232 domain-containing protein [Spirochaetes bacterium]|nr:DUF1232 domain-containing protein [Spirochaetota bacterium]
MKLINSNKIKLFKNYIKKRIFLLKNDIKTIYFAYQRKDIGLLPKLIALITISYALSPIDLIPDFIPILGYVDDFLILPLLIMLSIKLIPKEIIDECRLKAKNEKIEFKKNWKVGFIIILFWIFIIFLLIYKIFKLIVIK